MSSDKFAHHLAFLMAALSLLSGGCGGEEPYAIHDHPHTDAATIAAGPQGALPEEPPAIGPPSPLPAC